MEKKLAIIGGSGLHDPHFVLSAPRVRTVHTQYGLTCLYEGEIDGETVIFIPRHGEHDETPPGQIDYRSNIAALVSQRVSHVLTTTAVGALNDGFEVGDFVVLDQFVDFTTKRVSSFYQVFEPDSPVHAEMADPFCPWLRGLLLESCAANDIRYHTDGTVITIEGPRFSTRAESRLFQRWGMDLVNMTTATEVALANEAKLAIASLAFVTDADSFDASNPPVTLDSISKAIASSRDKLRNVLSRAVAGFSDLARSAPVRIPVEQTGTNSRL